MVFGSHAVQSLTVRHEEAFTHCPDQHAPWIDATSPAGQGGGTESHAASLGSHSAARMQVPWKQRTPFTPALAHGTTGQPELHGGTGKVALLATQPRQQLLTSWQSLSPLQAMPPSCVATSFGAWRPLSSFVPPAPAVPRAPAVP